MTTAIGGQAGIDAFSALRNGRREPFDVVITDLGMPYVDGRAVAAAVKADVAAHAGLAAHRLGPAPEDRATVPAHVDRVLSKPPKLTELSAALAELTADTE